MVGRNLGHGVVAFTKSGERWGLRCRTHELARDLKIDLGTTSFANAHVKQQAVRLLWELEKSGEYSDIPVPQTGSIAEKAFISIFENPPGDKLAFVQNGFLESKDIWTKSAYIAGAAMSADLHLQSILMRQGRGIVADHR